MGRVLGNLCWQVNLQQWVSRFADTCVDEDVEHPFKGGVEILLVASCYRNWSDGMGLLA